MTIKLNTSVKLKKNNKVWKQMERNLKRGGRHKVQVGFFDGVYPDGISVPQIAAWNEEGHFTGWGAWSPPRPFIRLGVMRKVGNQTWIRKWNRHVHSIAMGRLTWKDLNKLIAKELVEIMKEEILDWDIPPNRPSTVAKKGFNDPLVETGLMYSKVKAKVLRIGINR